LELVYVRSHGSEMARRFTFLIVLPTLLARADEVIE